MAHKQQIEEIKKKLERSNKIIETIREHIKGTETDGKERFFLICDDKTKFHPEGMWKGRKDMPGMFVKDIIDKGCTIGDLFGDHHTHPKQTKGTISVLSYGDLLHFIYEWSKANFPSGGIMCVSEPQYPNTFCYRLKHHITEDEENRVLDIIEKEVKDRGRRSYIDRYFLYSLFDRIEFRYRKPYVSKKKEQATRDYIKYMRKHGYPISLPEDILKKYG